MYLFLTPFLDFNFYLLSINSNYYTGQAEHTACIFCIGRLVLLKKYFLCFWKSVNKIETCVCTAWEKERENEREREKKRKRERENETPTDKDVLVKVMTGREEKIEINGLAAVLVLVLARKSQLKRVS